MGYVKCWSIFGEQSICSWTSFLQLRVPAAGVVADGKASDDEAVSDDESEDEGFMDVDTSRAKTGQKRPGDCQEQQSFPHPGAADECAATSWEDFIGELGPEVRALPPSELAMFQRHMRERVCVAAKRQRA